MRRALAGLLGLIACALGAGAGATPSGRAWKNLPVHYKVFQHSQINGVADFSQVLPRVQSGFARWNRTVVPCTRWESTYDGVFTSPTGRNAINGLDGQNLVLWLGGTDWTHDDATLGLTTTTYLSGSGELIDSDVELNNNRAWKLGGATLAVDVESILTHEAGHFLGLDHSPPMAAIMYAIYPIGDVKVDLTSTDITDVCAVYPTLTDGGTLGTFCTSDSICGTTAPFCRGAADGGSRICTTVCTGPAAACPSSSYSCQAASPDGGMACLVRTGSRDLCRFCTSGSECLSGNCVADDGRRYNWCTVSCRTAADCGPGYDCVSAGTSSVCAPSGAPPVCPARQCTGSADCAPGYACNAQGMCEATGLVGDRCEVSTWCTSCATCVGTYEEAYCRACCGGTGAGGACSGCANPACGGSLSCAQLGNQRDYVCVPTSGTSCQACDSLNPCQPGSQCMGGRCHAACNPAHPGNCSACYPVGSGGVGYCACADELAYTGQACEPPPGGFVACTNGNACVGSPKTCRPRCTLGDNSTCSGGAACTLVDGQAVCMSAAGTPGTQCASSLGGSCSAGSCAGSLACHGGRCYEPCDPANPICSSCVVVVPGSVAVCACDDQRVGVGQSCGVTSTSIAVCAPGSECSSGTCRAQCNPGASGCRGGESCQHLGGSWVCVPVPDAGTQDAGSDGGPGTVQSGGCGCTSAGGWLPAVLPLTLLLLHGRRRRSGDRRSVTAP